MTVDTLFGTETIPANPRTIKFKQIKAVYETLTIKVYHAHVKITFAKESNQLLIG